MKPSPVPVAIGLTYGMIEDIAAKFKKERPETFDIIRRLDQMNLLDIWEISVSTNSTIEEVYSVAYAELI